MNDSLNRTQKALNLDKSADDKAAILKATTRVKQEAEEKIAKETGGKKGTASSTNPAQRGVAKPTARSSRMDVEDDDDASVPGAARGKVVAAKGKKAPAAKANKRGAREETPDNSEDDFDVGSPDEFQHPAGLSDRDEAGSDEDSVPAKSRGGAKGKVAAKPKAAATAGRGKAAAKSPAPAAAKKKVAAETSARPAARRAAASKVRNCIVFVCIFLVIVTCSREAYNIVHETLSDVPLIFPLPIPHTGRKLRAERRRGRCRGHGRGRAAQQRLQQAGRWRWQTDRGGPGQRRRRGGARRR